MTDTSDVERAERISRSRARLFLFQGILFLSWQGLFLTGSGEGGTRTVDEVKIWTWFVWVAALLALLATGGGLLRNRSLRPLLNDELTRSNRAKAYAAGFWAAMIIGILLYVADLFEAVSAREAIHVTLSTAIAAALITFAARERREKCAL
jgi:hypothetical protein